MTATPAKSSRTMLYNVLFLAVCGGLFFFLWNAPPESTAKLPHDETHEKYFAMDKKEAEKDCERCHNPQGEVPLPPGHPPKYRCLFCHKKK